MILLRKFDRIPCVMEIQTYSVKLMDTRRKQLPSPKPC